MSLTGSNYVYTSDPGIIFGFHGCEKWLCDAVVSGKEMLNASEKIHDWLGHGIYFWQNNYERALEFVTNPPDGRTFKEPAVLGAVICLNNCLDLLDTKYIKHVRNSYLTLQEFATKEGNALPLPRNKNKKGSTNAIDKVVRELDCYVIENLHAVMKKNNVEPFDSVRGVFIEGDPIYTDAGFYDKTHIQVCIRNPNCIKGLFLPRHEVKWP